ncbi:MAG: phospho-sugar mutase [Planctomycetes bacterium]|nr:phospho-sugar mutase [Planctomycetota bacterium]
MSETLAARVSAWIEQDPCPEDRAELEALLQAEDWAELSERFAGPLAFGTAGLRGVLGAGETRMNRAVVIRTSYGLGKALLARDPAFAERGVAIGYDGRRGSLQFSKDSAGVLLALGIRVHLTRGTCPTPLLAYAVTHLDAAAGVVVTASHNPPEYNGYKVYAPNGAQIVPPWDHEIASQIATAPGADAIEQADLASAEASGRLVYLGEEMDASYLSAIRALYRIEAADPNGTQRRELGIVYTPLHGVGRDLIVRTFAEAGFEKLSVVPEQAEPDGEFPTVRFPNPEEPGALDLALAQAEREGASLIVANDPDADRLACVVKAKDGSFRPLTGNQIGVLLGTYLLEREELLGLDPPEGAADRMVAASIVSSPQLGAAARAMGVYYEETLTGFKWIANQALAAEAERGARFVFGYEEALGYTVGTVVRDKDGISAAVILCELVAYLAERGETLLDRLDALARRTGVYLSGQRATVFPGQEGAQTMATIMERIRSAPPSEVAGQAVIAFTDISAGERRPVGGPPEPIRLPKSNVLVFDFAGGDRIIARPSGTEPKLKLYFDVCEPVAANESVADAQGRAAERMSRLQEAFSALATPS